MAKTKRDDFDAEGFIEAMRVSAVPTYHTAEKKEIAAPPKEETPSIDTVKETKSPSSKKLPYEVSGDNIEKEYRALGFTSEEIDFVKKFISRNNFQKVVQGKSLFIRKEYHKLIVRLLQLTDGDCSISSYVDNVLYEHFRSNFTIMQGITDKVPSLF